MKEIPLPKNSLEAAYRLVVDIAEMFLIHNCPLHQFEGEYPIPTPSKAETEFHISMLSSKNGEHYQRDPNNASVVPSDLLDRLSNAVSDLEQIEESYWWGENKDAQ